MEKVLVIGLGEVGIALYNILRECELFKVYGYDVDRRKTIDTLDSIEKPIDYLHIAIPYTEKFVNIVKEYISTFKPVITYIHSTVSIGTTKALHEAADGATIAYTPVRGKHPNLVKHMMFWTKWVVSIPLDKIEECVKHLELAGFKVKAYRGSPESLELAKLWETVYRAIMIASWQELHRIARKFNADLDVIVEFVGEVHEVLRDRPIYFPNYIGGHCLIPNTKILLKQYPSKLLEFIIESNERRLSELEDEAIRVEVELLKKKAMKYANIDYYEGKID